MCILMLQAASATAVRVAGYKTMAMTSMPSRAPRLTNGAGVPRPLESNERARLCLCSERAGALNHAGDSAGDGRDFQIRRSGKKRVGSCLSCRRVSQVNKELAAVSTVASVCQWQSSREILYDRPEAS